ncbi:MAG: GyrI-like domain-containing protein [Clostridia bacterium]|nr:GyrI-like domain-containing protein [Clostridia bacterium]
MKTTIMEKKEFKVIGIEIRTTNEGGRGAMEGAQLWQKFFAENILEKIPNKINPAVNYGLYTEFDENFNIADGYYTYLACVEVSSLESIPEGMVGKTITSSKYVVITTEGPFPQKIGEAWQYIWETSSWDTDGKRAFKADFEVYDASRYLRAENPEMDIYISIT